MKRSDRVIAGLDSKKVVELWHDVMRGLCRGSLDDRVRLPLVARLWVDIAEMWVNVLKFENGGVDEFED